VAITGVLSIAAAGRILVTTVTGPVGDCARQARALFDGEGASGGVWGWSLMRNVCSRPSRPRAHTRVEIVPGQMPATIMLAKRDFASLTASGAPCGSPQAPAGDKRPRYRCRDSPGHSYRA
jgi:hypothetical protein